MGSSKVLGALDTVIAKKCEEEESSDSDIEVLGPFPAAQNPQSKPRSKGKEKADTDTPLQPLHPLFLQKPHRDRPGEAPGLSKRQEPTSGTNFASPNAPTVAPASSNTKAAAPPYKHTKPMRTDKVKASTVSKESAPDLPAYSYKHYTDPKPYLVYTTDVSETDDLVAGLKPGPVALDIEWRVFFVRRGAPPKERRTAVVQVADTRGLMLVVQIYGMDRFPKNLQALIENPEVPKLGVNILNDGRKLFRDYGILAKNLVELGALAAVADPTSETKRKIISLAKLTEKYCGKTLEKGNVRTGNWEAPLTQRQLAYAANDVHSSLMIYKRLLALAEEHSITLDLTAFRAGVEPSFSCPPVSRTASTASVEEPDAESGSMAMEMRPQCLRAYRYWHDRDMAMEKMCVELSLKGKSGVEGTLGERLKVGTVITYIVSALQADRTLPFEIGKLRDLVQMDAASWVRHREWILSVWKGKVGVQGQAESEDAPS
ncbi:putative 3'-5' exonuclease [Lyophyllum shimeji]|uniref:3'-5' exonuclease n=1 Tax=Lyophyllum shimeji TaxID=47721 RepID=A0A9P3PRF4_LYOSH|nr:putative 3'-5' exonuclease [Lyophyllum shimeji]